jgi:hypothetical protein
MNKITIKLDDALFEKIQSRLANSENKTLSQCIRELIELGLEAETISTSTPKSNDANENLHFLLSMLKTTMTWTMETRLLARILVENSDIEDNKANDYMRVAKERSASHIDKVIQELQNNLMA